MKLSKTIILIFSLLAVCAQGISQSNNNFKPKELYKSSVLVITQISKDAFLHESYAHTNDFGKVPCNGLVIRNGDEVIVFDTPTNDTSSIELIKWLKEKLHCKINAVIPTHFHTDCLGGLKAFHDNNIPSYANNKTIALASTSGYTVPINGFNDSTIIRVGNEDIVAKFYGEGHSKDNVIGYCPNENILFGGCLIKELDATKGYLGDANTNDWSGTVEKIKKDYSHIKIVVPGHGKYGDARLLDYTIKLFKAQ